MSVIIKEKMEIIIWHAKYNPTRYNKIVNPSGATRLS